MSFGEEPNVDPTMFMSIIGVLKPDGHMQAVDIEGSYKGYHVRAYEPDKADSLVPKPYEEDSLIIACPLYDRGIFLNAGAIPDLCPAPPELDRLLNLLDSYHRLNRKPNQDREQKVHLLQKLRGQLEHYLTNHEFDRTENQQREMLVEMQKQIREEFWALFGMTKQQFGKIYLPEHEVPEETVENFASGNSASIARVTYQDGLVAVFKASSAEQKITAEAAKEFGIDADDSESARLPHRSVMFCELDAVLGIHLTPPTWYAIHNDMPGSCQCFVQGCHISKREFLDQPYREDDVYIVAQVVNGEMKDQGYGFKLADNAHVEPASLAHMSDTDLQQLYMEKKLILTREQLTDIAPIDLSRPETQKAMADAELLDHIGGSIDRNQSNIIFVEETDPVRPDVRYFLPRLIDNDLSFAPEHVHDNQKISGGTLPFLANMAGSLPGQIDAETADKFLAVSFEQVRELISLHQVCSSTEMVSQRERFSNLKNAIIAAKKGKLSPVKIIHEWNESTFAAAQQNPESYIAKTHQCRMNDLIQLIDADASRAAQCWAEQFHLLGAKPLAMAMRRERLQKIEYALHEYSRKVVIKDPADVMRACTFISTLLENHHSNLEPVEKSHYAARFLDLMLGHDVFNKHIGKALAICADKKMLSIPVMETLLKKAVKNARASGDCEGWTPSTNFSKKMAFLGPECPVPELPVKVAFSDCYEEVKTKMATVNFLRFWGLLQVYTIPLQRKQKGYNLSESPELSHAMHFFTPDFLKEAKKQPVKKLPEFFRKNCFTPAATGLSEEGITQVIETLVFHFDIAERLPDRSIILSL